jgi:cytochrome P450
MNHFIREPEKYENWLGLYSSNVIYRLGFGETITQGDDWRLERIHSIVHTVERVASPGAYLVDTFPSLMKLPDVLAPFKKELKALHRIEVDLFRDLLETVRSKMLSGKAPACWERTFLENQEKFKLTDDEGAYVVGTLYEAGSSTTAAAVASTLLALVHYPEWMRKLEEEIDSVVGNDRMPEFGDMSKLPTVRAVVKESLRWRPVTAGGVPHQLDQDDVYDGFFLPKGTNVHANQWCICPTHPVEYCAN